jgi:hypothetical protein
METPPVSQRQIAAFRRFIDLLPHTKDVDLIILKAHLLIEEQVNAIAAARLVNPGVLMGEHRFESVYRIKLAQSFFPAEKHLWVWKALEQLNTLRNRVAHSIEPKGKDNIMKNVVELVPGASSKESSLQEQFEFALWLLHSAVSALVEPPRGEPIELVQAQGAT